jgi:hypothetical protein
LDGASISKGVGLRAASYNASTWARGCQDVTSVPSNYRQD